MNRYLLIVLCSCHAIFADNAKDEKIAQHYMENIEEPEAVIFAPPPGWLAADPANLPRSVKAMVVGKGPHDYPPSINLGTEKYEGSLKSYLKNIKLINEAQNATWKDLGQISTESGSASLSQVDMKTEWGDVRLMHAIILRYGTAYILTAAALKEDFNLHYKDFFAAMRSLKVNKDVYEMVKNPEKRAKLQTTVQNFKKKWLEYVNQAESNHSYDDLFTSEKFQKEEWIPFTSKVGSEYAELGNTWKEHLCNKAKEELGLN